MRRGLRHSVFSDSFPGQCIQKLFICYETMCVLPKDIPNETLLQVVVVDEGDMCWREHRDPLNKVLAAACSQAEKPSIVFAGATVDGALYDDLVDTGWLSYPCKVESLSKRVLPAGLTHRCAARFSYSSVARALHTSFRLPVLFSCSCTVLLCSFSSSALAWLHAALASILHGAGNKWRKGSMGRCG